MRRMRKDFYSWREKQHVRSQSKLGLWDNLAQDRTMRGCQYVQKLKVKSQQFGYEYYQGY